MGGEEGGKIGVQVEDRRSVWRVGDEHVWDGELDCEDRDELADEEAAEDVVVDAVDDEGADGAADVDAALECDGDTMGDGAAGEEARL